MLKKIFSFFLDLIFPRECLGCRKENTWLCQDCLDSIPLSKKQEKNIITNASYDNKLLRVAIHALKYSYIEQLAQPLGQLLLEGFKKSIKGTSSFDLIIPIPLHKKRFKERGFNQSKLIALPMARYLNCPVSEDVLIRRKNTTSQMTLNRVDRLKNVENAFAAKKSVINKKILLVDDVVTTGSTLHHATQALKNAGAKEVLAIVLARD